MNETRKQRFISTLEQEDAARARSFFELITGREKQCELDIAEWSSPDTDAAIREVARLVKISFNGDKISARITVARILYLYNKWCRKNKIPANPDITRSKYVKVAKAATWVIDSPEEVQKLLDIALMPEQTRATDLYCRGVVWLAYAGLSMDEIADATTDDYDPNTTSIVVRRKGGYDSIKIPECGVTSLAILASTNSFFDYGDAIKGPISVPRRDGNLLVRARAAKRVATNWETRNKKTYVRNTIKVVQNRISNRSITYDALYKNGFYYRAWRDECQLPENERLEFVIPDDPSHFLRMNYRIYIDELEKLVSHFTENSDELVDTKKARQYWRSKIYNEYLLWKWVSRKR